MKEFRKSDSIWWSYFYMFRGAGFFWTRCNFVRLKRTHLVTVVHGDRCRPGWPRKWQWLESCRVSTSRSDRLAERHHHTDRLKADVSEYWHMSVGRCDCWLSSLHQTAYSADTGKLKASPITRIFECLCPTTCGTHAFLRFVFLFCHQLFVIMFLKYLNWPFTAIYRFTHPTRQS